MQPVDVWVWAVFGVLLVLMAARAWVVETGAAGFGRTPVREQVLTGAVVATLVVLVVLVVANGGAELAGMLISGEDTPAPPAIPADPAPPADSPADGAAADPGAPPAGEPPITDPDVPGAVLPPPAED